MDIMGLNDSEMEDGEMFYCLKQAGEQQWCDSKTTNYKRSDFPFDDGEIQHAHPTDLTGGAFRNVRQHEGTKLSDGI